MGWDGLAIAMGDIDQKKDRVRQSNQSKFVISHPVVFPISSIHPFTTSAQVGGSTLLLKRLHM